MLVDIILVYNDWSSAITLLKSMEDFTCFDKIVVVDNCSPNGAYEKLLPFSSDRVHVIQTEENRGVAYGNNFGARYAERLLGKVDFFLFSNPDVIVEEKCIQGLVELLRTHTDAGAAAPLEISAEGEIGRDFAWRMPKYHQFLLSVLPVYVTLAMRSNKPYIWYYDPRLLEGMDVFKAEVIISCFIMVRGEAYRQVGGFCEKTFLYNEENFFAWMLREKGWEEYILVSERVIHLGCTSMKKGLDGWERSAAVLHDSNRIFLSECLRIGRLKMGLYELAYKLGIFERKAFRLISGRKNNARS